MKKRKNGKRKTTTKMKIGEPGNRPLKKKRSYIVTIRRERKRRTQNDKSAEVTNMGKKKGKKKSKKKGEER
ncbi:MAG: hypothetical protein JSV15_04600 [Candidatus Bathyarchaeota archaeon]|nr:MAG: hypothetical protein JSV15_04600 [Candidatus Bathyarchaeota archaeon]